MFESQMANQGNLPPAFIAFQGGGSLGMAHLAAWREVSQQFKIIATVGTSAGSIVAAFCAARYSPEHTIEVFQNLDWTKFVKRQGLLKLITEQDAYSDGKAFHTWLQSALGQYASESVWRSQDVTFSELYHFSNIYLAVVACDLNDESDKPVVFDKDREPQTTVSFAVRASISIPGFFTPMSRPDRNQELVDGGVLLNFPIELLHQRAREANATLIGVRFSEEKNLYLKEPKIIDTLKATYKLKMRQGSNLPTAIREDPNYIDIEINVSEFNPFSFDLSQEQKNELLKRGQEAAKTALLKHQVKMSKQIQLSPSLLQVIEPSKQRAKEIDVPYYTPFLLLALLQSPCGIPQKCFNQVQEGLANRIISNLEDWIRRRSEENSEEKFKDFRWDSDNRVIEARKFAHQDSSLYITKKHLLLAVLLDSESNIIQAIKSSLGEYKFEQIIEAVKRTPIEWRKRPGTPDTDNIV